ncbi:TIGR02679 domain-containing protein [Nocardia sp. FBN12]|uniref:TIGR02679 domain-containing protein n=1 Tax=Nocardia sp. FBN12 TaxID=3419766 RepID=UPI003D08D5C4
MPKVPIAALSADLMPLWHALHHRLGSGRAVASVKVAMSGTEQRTALADLFGMAALPGAEYTVNCARLDAVLVELTGLTGRDVVERMVGPIEDRAA